MVNFENISYDSDWLYATANIVGEVNKYEVKVKRHSKIDEYYISPSGYDMAIVKAMWCIVFELNKKGKIAEKKMVYWG